MLRSKDILNCLPLLAAVLGRNYGVKVHIGGCEAKTNGKVIYLSTLPVDCEAELLGFARGYIDHEAAHIRHSDFPALHEARLDPATLTIANALEDWRVEQRQIALYPGCRQHLAWLARKLCLESVKDAQEAGAHPASCILEYIIRVSSAWAVPEVWPTLQPVQKSMDTHFPGLRGQIDAVLDRAHTHCPDTAAAIGYAREIADCLKRWQPPTSQQEDSNQQEQQENRQAQGDTPGTGTHAPPDAPAGRESRGQNRDEDDAASVNPETPIAPGAHSPANREEDDQTDCVPQAEETARSNCHQQSQEEGGAASPAAPVTAPLAALFGMDAEALPKTRGEYAAQCLLRERTSHPWNPWTTLTVATVGTATPSSVLPAKKEDALRAGTALRQRLHGLLQAHTRQDVGTGRRGRLHTAKLHRLRVGNPHVFRKEEEHAGLSTAVHILLDASGSMRGEAISLARQACYAIAKALHGVKGINPAVTVFPAHALHNGSPDDSVCPLMAHGEKLPPYLMVGANGGTPLAPALWWVMQTMLPLEENRKLILVLTDGEPDSIPPTVNAVEAAQKAGFEVYAIGIRSTAIARLLPQTSRCITSLAELAPAMFTLLQQALMRGGNHTHRH